MQDDQITELPETMSKLIHFNDSEHLILHGGGGGGHKNGVTVHWRGVIIIKMLKVKSISKLQINVNLPSLMYFGDLKSVSR